MGTRLTSEERREHLLHVGVELLGRHGTADISIEEFDRNLDGFLRFVDVHAEGYLAVVNARGSEPRVQKLIEERRRRRVDELVALAALLWDVPRDVARTPLLIAAIEGWLGFSEGVIVRWLREREIGRDEV